MKTLLIVESPKKAKHIAEFLGKEYQVLATLGHIKDLPSKELGVDVSKGFNPKWVTLKGKMDIIKRIKEAAQSAGKIIIASDPDREGEAIASHVYQLLSLNVRKKVKRAEFTEITKSGVMNGLSNLREIDQDMVESQQARRVMDRLTGFMVSPMLWRRIRGYQSLSAGRVQSAALKMIYDRQKEIDEFEQSEYWTIDGQFDVDGTGVFASLTHLDQKSLEEKPVTSEKETRNVIDIIKILTYRVIDVESGNKSYTPPAPFITTTLLQSASSRLGLNSKKTMAVVQELFEGILIHGESHGLITYMRTDSPRVSTVAQEAAREWIREYYGSQYIPVEPVIYNAKEGAQDAHECIRPTNINLSPDEMKDHLSTEQFRLYELIWWRFLISQMAPAIHHEVKVKLYGKSQDHNTQFYAFSSEVIFKGWRLIEGGMDDRQYQPGLEHLQAGDFAELKELDVNQHFTKQPPNFTEASLIKKLEKQNIGRPSTYATIIDTLISKKYVQVKSNKLIITDVGKKVIETLDKVFPLILDTHFTSEMEEELDRIAHGEIPWRFVVSKLYAEICKIE